EQEPIEVTEAGVLHLHTLGITAQLFPIDEGLPTLADCCDTGPGSRLCRQLEGAAGEFLNDPAWQISEVHARPMRYKPGSHCVICYQLQLRHAFEEETRPLTLFGKVYADERRAHAVQASQFLIYAEQMHIGVIPPMLPQPSGQPEDLRLVISEALQGESLCPGTRALQAHVEYGDKGGIRCVVLPVERLKRTATALAIIHQSDTLTGKQTLHTGSKEAKKVLERARLLAEYYPAFAHEITTLAERLSKLLYLAQPERYGLAHGNFKPSQILFTGEAIAVVDFDSVCLADPALDIGYFLAYLRPPQLWHGRSGMRSWFEGAEQTFCDTYRQALELFDEDSAAIENVFARARLYTAALIFKIATRRVHRLNSPRPQELKAMLSEIQMCMPPEKIY
ncbi:MAG: phosphotransferase, partial [Ktedonobacteraceae bacterium]|nr:phosphotransferase [Ktedonobacteraceae bacterium]